MSYLQAYDPGRMDRRVLIQVYTQTVQANGERTWTWTDYDWRWAELVSTSGNEVETNEAIIIVTSCIFRLRYDAVVTEKYRLIYHNRIYNITGINEVGRMQFMDIACEAGDIATPITADSDLITADADTVTADATMF